ncbi:MAG TPA: hypothetical protein VFH95_14985 [Candidatus Kapabacteria bacterium]|nr:hypothetical protein [Candidatus Kapabacteria bacterium]
MKKKLFLIGFSLIGLVSIAHAQKASEGKAVVSKGFEHSDSVRFGMLRPFDVAQWGGSTLVALINAQVDTLGCSAEEDFDRPIFVGNSTFYGHRKVMCALGTLDGASGPDLVNFGHTIFQRIYAPLAIPGHQAFRYNDIVFDTMPGVKAQVYNNSYDSEDINPYAEYPANPASVTQTFHTRRFSNIDSVVYYGNEGRVILGYSDDRNALDLLTTPSNYPFPSGAAPWDSAKAFSVNLEFSLDTSNINMMNAPNPSDTDHAPLVRLQVLFKPANQSVLPFVPFTNGSDTNHGWFKCLDTVITRANYRTLDTDWRAPDSTFTGNSGHNAHSWVFKQFHTMIRLDHTMDSIRQHSVSSPTDHYANDPNSIYMDNFGWSSDSANVLDNSFTNPDSIVAFASPNKADPLIEIRVLSSYRTTVRVRDVTYQDTMVDRYLHRRRFGDSTHSVEQNGSYGGNDHALDTTLQSWHALLGPNLPRELMYNDNGLPPAGLPTMGYLDYMGSKYQIYLHMRPQDNGAWSLAFRRARMSFDGQPPSIFENQENGYGALWMPRDYVYYGLKCDTGSLWGRSPFDTSMGQVIVRPEDTIAGDTNTLVGYNIFTLYNACASLTFHNIRAMARVGQWHPWSKRFATEYSIIKFHDVSNGAKE